MKQGRTPINLFAFLSILVMLLIGCKSTAPVAEPTVTLEVIATEQDFSPTITPRPVLEQPTSEPEPTDTPVTPTPTPEPTEAPPESSIEEPVDTPTVEASPTPTEGVSAAPTTQSFSKTAAIIARDALEIVPVVDPGPPISVEVSANQLLEGYRYRISGILRNESNENYTGLGVITTVFLESGNRYGPIHTNVKCLFLAPGATCPFVVEAVTKFATGVSIHVSGHPTPRTPLAPEYWGVGYTIDRIGYIHITGIVHNQYAVPAKHITVVGSLVNVEGEIVNVNSTIILEQLAPSETASFEINMKYVPFRSIQIVTQGEP
jgi:hypothetical protein